MSISQFRLIPNNITQYLPANPTGTNSETNVMMGLALSFTPKYTGQIKIWMCCQMTGDATNAGGVNLGVLKYGTGTAPTNGTAVTGTSIGKGHGATIPTTGGSADSFSLCGFLSSLSINTAYWVDLSLSVFKTGATDPTVSPTQIVVIIEEVQT